MPVRLVVTGVAVTRATFAHRAMVIDVEADRPEDARKIAGEIVDPLRAKYEEVLMDAARRVC